MSDMVNHPAHYAEGRKYEPIEVIYDWKLTYPVDDVVKYISRYGRKGDPMENLDKAKFYLDWFINKLKEEAAE
jgi:hypothetical protein